ncbi:MAG: pyridoxamine 5'-phosphate oxidase family protein [Acidimicrobiia bacterium]|nr:pyridoxamine 5'-phosphate oxidase family protein [Acidimicrobiia bacterium]
MGELSDVAPAFVEMAHRIVWASVATVDRHGRPRSRVLHPIWQWDGTSLVGWVATQPTRRAHLAQTSNVSCNYWAPAHDTCLAECRAELVFDEPTRAAVWDLFANGPEPVGYDPAIIPGWDDPSSPGFVALRLDPWRLRVMPGSVMLSGSGEVLTWAAPG